MSIDPAAAAALDAALAADPANVGLRIHVAGVFLSGDDAPRALQHLRLVLEQDPTNATAMQLAAEAERALGNDAVADVYDMMLRAAAATGAEPETLGVDAELDALLANESADVDMERPPLRLSDVAGMDDVKSQIDRSFLAPLRNAELRKMYRKSLRGGLLLYGPPGCGKTFLARAVAGELGAQFFSVDLHDILDMWIGQSERNVHETFERARRSAPCVLFLDEIDALGHKRSNLRQSAIRGTVVQLLSELDGIDEANEGLFVLAATNQPWDIDPALRRPGRFDRTLLVLPPDRAARRHIIDLHLSDRPVDDDIDLDLLAQMTERCSGADIRFMCDSATEYAMEDSIRLGRARPINQADLVRAAKSLRPSTTSWFELARNFAIFANPGGEYDQLIAYMQNHKLL
jgi:SpoVK/Ycf46/Vps4 family AAA+-type ATPase